LDDDEKDMDNDPSPGDRLIIEEVIDQSVSVSLCAGYRTIYGLWKGHMIEPTQRNMCLIYTDMTGVI